MNRRWVTLGVLLAAAAAGLLGWQLRRPAEPKLAVPSSAPAAPAGLAVFWTPASASVSAASRPMAVQAPSSAASMPGLPKDAAAKDFIEVCGIGRVRRSELERGDGQPEPAWMQTLNQHSEQGLSDLLKRLDAGSEKQRVAAAVLREDAQAAAQLAAATGDAMAYRLALRACRKDAAYRVGYASQRALPAASAASGFVGPEMPAPGPVPSACNALSLERLELLAPDDAWPWLVRLNDSVARADQAGIAQAMYQLAQRQRLAVNTRALSAAVAEVVGTEPTPGEAMTLVVAVGTDMASLVDGSISTVGRVCRGEMLNDANRRQLCEQVVRRMPDMAAEVMDARTLHVLEERLGLPHSPQALSRADSERAFKAMGEESMRLAEEPSCAAFSGMGRQIVSMAREGELAWVRAFLKSSSASAPH